MGSLVVQALVHLPSPVSAERVRAADTSCGLTCTMSVPVRRHSLDDTFGASGPARLGLSDADQDVINRYKMLQMEKYKTKSELHQLENNLFQMEKHYVQTPKQHGNIYTGATICAYVPAAVGPGCGTCSTSCLGPRY